MPATFGASVALAGSQVDIIEASAAHAADGQAAGRTLGPCRSIIFEEDVTVVGAGNVTLYYEYQGGDTKWYPLANSAVLAAVATSTTVISDPPPMLIRVRWDVSGGGNVTFSVKARQVY